jgi:hypothetical protein
MFGLLYILQFQMKQGMLEEIAQYPVEKYYFDSP